MVKMKMMMITTKSVGDSIVLAPNKYWNFMISDWLRAVVIYKLRAVVKGTYKSY